MLTWVLIAGAVVAVVVKRAVGEPLNARDFAGLVLHRRPPMTLTIGIGLLGELVPIAARSGLLKPSR